MKYTSYMTTVGNLFIVGCFLLAVGGAFKLARPLPTVSALDALLAWRGFRSLTGSVLVVRALGAGEITLGVAAAITGWAPLAALVAVTYVVFAGFVAVARARGTAVQSCGCFGEIEVPPSLFHFGINIGAAAVAAVVAVVGTPSLMEVLAQQPLAGVPFAVLTTAITYFAYLVLTALPATLRAATEVAARSYQGRRSATGRS